MALQSPGSPGRDTPAPTHILPIEPRPSPSHATVRTDKRKHNACGTPKLSIKKYDINSMIPVVPQKLKTTWADAAGHATRGSELGVILPDRNVCTPTPILSTPSLPRNLGDSVHVPA